MVSLTMQALNRYEIRCEPNIENVLRIINMFAQRGFDPENVKIAKRMNDYLVEISIRDIEHAHAALVAQKIAALVMIHSVEHMQPVR